MFFSKIYVFVFIVISVLAINTSHASSQTEGRSGTLEWKQINSFAIPANPVDIVYSLDGKNAIILTEEHTILIFDRQGNMKGSIPVGDGVTAIDVDPKGNFLYLVDREKNLSSTLAIDFIITLDVSDSPSLGNLNAPVTIAVFSDFE
jgi:DNA-binding beta-propeller fold protein YncE